MRSLGFTIILALLTVLVGGLSTWQWREGSFDRLLGAPPVPIGQRIYTDFATEEVRFIRVSQPGLVHNFELGREGWKCVSPYQDRADPQAAAAIIRFTLTLRVEDSARTEEIDRSQAGLEASGVNIRLQGADHRTLAKYKLGRQTPWLATVADLDQSVPTVFIEPRDADDRPYIYACTGDISAWFRDGFKYLRDFHPFAINPNRLQEIRIRAEQVELKLARATPDDPWRLVKPLELRTNPIAMKSLLDGLMNLRAAKLTDREAVTMSNSGAAAQATQIAITPFGADHETMLEIFPPEIEGSPLARATVSDRPNTVFTLPLKPDANIVSLADLPLTVNDLRDPALANLDVAKLRSILIQPATSPQILVSRTPPQPWMVTIGGQSKIANEERLFALLKVIKEGRATGFETDAATDFTPWGLDKPFLQMHFTGEAAGQEITLALAFGTDGNGNYFVNRVGTPTVMKVDPLLVASLPVKTYEWRNDRLWTLDRTQLTSIRRKLNAEPPLTLLYNFSTEDWKATSETKDLTARIAPARANYLLGVLENLKVTRWLSPDDEAAETSLRTPSLIILVTENTLDEDGEETGTHSSTVFVAPAGAGQKIGFYYGRLGDDPQPFLLDRDTYQKLATDVLEAE